MGGGIALLQQGIANGSYENINWAKVGWATLGGAVSGAILGGITSGLSVLKAAKMWSPGTSVRTSTSLKTMNHHYKLHGKEFGSIVKYTKEASNFAARNAKSLSFVARNPGLTPHWTFIGKVGMNGHFTSAGKILTFLIVP